MTEDPSHSLGMTAVAVPAARPSPHAHRRTPHDSALSGRGLRVDVHDDGHTRRSASSGPKLSLTRSRTGTRCTTFVKLPVALSGGRSANLEPVAALTLSTQPFTDFPPYASTSISAGWPTRMSASCVSLK